MNSIHSRLPVWRVLQLRLWVPSDGRNDRALGGDALPNSLHQECSLRGEDDGERILGRRWWELEWDRQGRKLKVMIENGNEENLTLLHKGPWASPGSRTFEAAPGAGCLKPHSQVPQPTCFWQLGTLTKSRPTSVFLQIPNVPVKPSATQGICRFASRQFPEMQICKHKWRKSDPSSW